MIERFLAQLYTDEALLRRFIIDTEKVLKDVDPETAAALRTIDLDDLQAAARSYRHKRLSRSRD